MKTREELDAEWVAFAAGWLAGKRHGLQQLEELLAAERAYVDREVAVRTIRFAATWTAGGKAVLMDLANRVERGETEVPK